MMCKVCVNYCKLCFLGRKLADDYYDRHAGFDRVSTDIGLNRQAADDYNDNDARKDK